MKKKNIEQEIRNAVKDYMTKDLFSGGYTPEMALEPVNYKMEIIEQNIVNDLLVIIKDEVSAVLNDLVAKDHKPGLDSLISDAEQQKQTQKPSLTRQQEYINERYKGGNVK